MNIDNNIFFHCYNIYTLFCASTSCLISHDARIIPSSTERSCITIEHSYYKNNSDYLLSKYAVKSVFTFLTDHL